MMYSLFFPLIAVCAVSVNPLSAINEISGVSCAAYVTNGEVAVVAVLTEPIFLRSEREKIVKTIEKILDKDPQFCGKRIAVTFSPQLYARCGLNPTNAEISKLYKAALQG